MATLNSRVRIPGDVLFRDLDGEAVLLNLTTGQYHGLDRVGTAIWNELAGHGEVEPAYQALLGQFEVAGEQLQRDVLRLIDELAAAGLLEVEEP
jgi:Coenzyme PQQ synthesis protein D (PqqD)